MACFSSPKSDRQLTSFHQQSTTTSPSKNHVLHPVFAKTPSKNGETTSEEKLLQKRSLFGLGLGFFWWDDYGGGYLVLGFEVEELDALGAAAGGADGFGVDADDLAELADDHELAGLVDEVDAGDLADLGGRLHVDDALAAAGLEAVLVDVGALAVAVLGDREDEAGREAELLVEFFELGRGLIGDNAGALSSAGSPESSSGVTAVESATSSMAASTWLVRPFWRCPLKPLLVAGFVGWRDCGADDVVALAER